MTTPIGDSPPTILTDVNNSLSNTLHTSIPQNNGASTLSSSEIPKEPPPRSFFTLAYRGLSFVYSLFKRIMLFFAPAPPSNEAPAPAKPPSEEAVIAPKEATIDPLPPTPPEEVSDFLLLEPGGASPLDDIVEPLLESIPAPCLQKPEPSTVSEIEYFPISEENKQSIHWLLDALATRSIPSLGIQYAHFEALGATLKRDVHPYRFLIVSLSNKTSKQNLILVSKRQIIWNNFTKNLGKNFDSRPALSIKETAYFAHALKVDASRITPLIQGKKWGEFLAYLIANAR